MIVAVSSGPLVQHPVGILTVLLLVLAAVFWLANNPRTQNIFKIVPALVFCYFIPTTLTTLGVLPDETELYTWIKTFLLPASLFLLILALDVPAILRLGWKPVVMLLSGTVGVVLGGPIALFVGQTFLTGNWTLPPDAWKGLAALSGSWIGGGANFVAIGDSVGTSGTMLSTMVVPDVLVANIWMGILLYLAGHQHWIDRRRGVDASAIRHLEQKLTEFHKRTARIPTLADLIIILALGFAASWVSYQAANALTRGDEQSVIRVAHQLEIDVIHFDPDQPPAPLSDPRVKPIHVGRAIDRKLSGEPGGLDSLGWDRPLGYRLARIINDQTGGGMWKYVIVTTIGLIASFTGLRRLEGAGASQVGSVFLYLLVATIGATANFTRMAEAPGYIVVGFIWMSVHVMLLLTVGWLIKAPIFYVAVGSQANIGGAASAPVVASAYHPSLAPVGVLLAVAGYVLGTYAGLICAGLLRWIAGAG
jgi:uncharacterized membrane protein